MEALNRFTQEVEAREARPRDTNPRTPDMHTASTSDGLKSERLGAGRRIATTTVTGVGVVAVVATEYPFALR